MSGSQQRDAPGLGGRLPNLWTYRTVSSRPRCSIDDDLGPLTVVTAATAEVDSGQFRAVFDCPGIGEGPVEPRNVEVMMLQMLCRNRVSDFSKWKAVFDSHAEAHRDAGLRLVNLWRCVEESTNIFFVLEVDDLDRAREFINSPDSARAGEESGVVDGEYYFFECAPGF